jgi:PDZ domain-containing protein
VGLRAIIAKSGAGIPLSITVERAGETKTVRVTPELSTDAKPVPIIGIFPAISYTYPFEVKIQLQDVGGPSAGQMFALGIIDKLTPGSITGGAKVAGTGTIDAAGNVGAIGGIRQKLYGARDAGATWFLAPYSNSRRLARGAQGHQLRHQHELVAQLPGEVTARLLADAPLKMSNHSIRYKPGAVS